MSASFFQLRTYAPLNRDLVVALAVVMVVILQEEMLVGTVTGESNAGNAEAREDALETVDAAEGTGVSPGLAGVNSQYNT